MLIQNLQNDTPIQVTSVPKSLVTRTGLPEISVPVSTLGQAAEWPSRLSSLDWKKVALVGGAIGIGILAYAVVK